MKLTLLSLAAFACVASIALLRAADELKRDGEEKLVTWVEKISPGVFAEKQALVGTSSYGKPLPATTDGMKRWDVSGFLKDRGVVFGPGAEAILLEDGGDLVVTNTLRQIEIMERVFNLTDEGPEVPMPEIEAALWVYDAPAAHDPALKPVRFSDLKKAAGNSLRRLDTVSVIARSGFRCANVSRHGAHGTEPQPPRQPAGSKEEPVTPRLGSAKGTELELESVIGPDGYTIDLQIAYLARLPQGSDLPDIEVSHITNISVVHKQDLIIYTALAPGTAAGKPKQVALVLSARIIPAEARPQERAEERKKLRLNGNPAIIEKARGGLTSNQ